LYKDLYKCVNQSTVSLTASANTLTLCTSAQNQTYTRTRTQKKHFIRQAQDKNL